MSVRAFEREVPPLVAGGPDDLRIIADDDRVKLIRYLKRVNAFHLDPEPLAGNQSLDNSILPPVEREDGLVREERRLSDQLGVEVGGRRVLTGKNDSVWAPELDKRLGEDVLSDALIATDGEGPVRMPFRMLNGVGHPTDHDLIVSWNAGADIFEDVSEIKRAVALLWFEGETLP